MSKEGFGVWFWTPRFKWGKLAASKSQSSAHFMCSAQTSCLWPRSRLRLKVVDNARVRDECGSSNPFTNTVQCSSRRKNSRKMRFGFSWRILPPILLMEKCGSCGGVCECEGGKGLWGAGLAALSSGVTWGHRFLSKQTDGGAQMAPHLNISDTERPKPHQNIFLPFLHLGRQLNTAWNWFSWSLVYFTSKGYNMQICLKTLREEDFQVARTNKYLYTTKKIKNMRVKSRRRKNMTFATTPLSLNPTPLILYST